MSTTTIPWREYAFCNQPWVRPEWFSFDRGDGMARMYTAAAKAVCAECPIPVRFRCLADALRHNDGYSIRGGLLPTERGTFDNTDRAQRKEARKNGVPYWTAYQRMELADELERKADDGGELDLVALLIGSEAGAA